MLCGTIRTVSDGMVAIDGLLYPLVLIHIWTNINGLNPSPPRFECTKQACGGKEKLVLLEKDPGSAKSYAFVHAGKLTVKEFTFAEISAAEMECVKKACPKDSLPVVEEGSIRIFG